MPFFLSALAFIVIFSILILVHEFGHFWMARRAGVKVEEFGFGLPPRAWGVKKGETLYSLNWIPFGGFVRMFGEDSKNAKMLSNPKSFASKPLRWRIGIVVAGVFMNFVLALVLLTIGFTVGMQPLLVTSDDVVKSIDTGVMTVTSGVAIKSVDNNSIAQQAGFHSGDVIAQMDGKDLSEETFFTVLKKPSTETHQFLVRRDNMTLNLQAHILQDQTFGLNFYESFLLPRVVLKGVNQDTDAYKAGVRTGDRVLALNGQQVYMAEDFQNLLLQSSEATLTVERRFQTFTYTFTLPQSHTVLVVDILPESPAAKAGFQKGDILVQVADKNISDVGMLGEFTQTQKGVDLTYVVERDGKIMTLTAQPDPGTGHIGVQLDQLFSQKNSIFDMYTSQVMTSALNVKAVSYPLHIAFLESLSEAKRLTSLTAVMFVNVIRDVVGNFEVPQGVAGPVGIARMTHVFAQEGFVSLMRFMALLSLSLGVINVFPFPALDGGRLLFLLIELVTGRQANQRVETVIHTVGFAVLILLIFLVTYNDIVRIFVS